MAVLVELVRSGQPDHAGTDDDDLHALSRCHGADLVGWCAPRRQRFVIAAIHGASWRTIMENATRDCGVRHT
jgi:hypothetical protein